MAGSNIRRKSKNRKNWPSQKTPKSLANPSRFIAKYSRPFRTPNAVWISLWGLIWIGALLPGSAKGQQKLKWHTQPELSASYSVYDQFKIQSAWIENPTQSTIVIENIQTTGDGLLTYLSHQTIPSGEKVELLYTFQPKSAIPKQRLSMEIWPKGGKQPLLWRAHPEVKSQPSRAETPLVFNLKRKSWTYSLIEVGRIWADETVELPVQLMNDYESPLKITAVHTDSEALTLDFPTGSLAPDESLSGKVTVNAAPLVDDRMLSERIDIPVWVEMEVDGQVQQKELVVWGHWLRKLVPDDLGKMPEITFDSTEIDLGTLVAGVPGEGRFSYANTGEYALQVEMVKTSSGSVVANWSKVPCYQGERGEITVKFNTRGKLGKQVKTCVVRVNDHRRTPILLRFTAEIIQEEDFR